MFRVYLRHRGSASAALKTTPLLDTKKHTTEALPWRREYARIAHTICSETGYPSARNFGVGTSARVSRAPMAWGQYGFILDS